MALQSAYGGLPFCQVSLHNDWYCPCGGADQLSRGASGGEDRLSFCDLCPACGLGHPYPQIGPGSGARPQLESIAAAASEYKRRRAGGLPFGRRGLLPVAATLRVWARHS